jgi:RNA polymerase sigma factor (sigma-70 family)
MGMDKTDEEIVSGLLSDDEQTIRHFFFNECTSLFRAIAHDIFGNHVDKNELINELYIHLKEKDWHVLRQFDYRVKLITWLSTVANHFFEKRRKKLIKNQSSEDQLIEQFAEEHDTSIEDTINSLLNRLKNERYRFVIQKIVLEDREPQKIAAEMGITVDNLYNIKQRAIQQLIKIKDGEYTQYHKSYNAVNESNKKIATKKS